MQERHAPVSATLSVCGLVAAVVVIGGCGGPGITVKQDMRREASRISALAHNALQKGDVAKAAEAWNQASMSMLPYTIDSDLDPELYSRNAIHTTNIAWANLIRGFTDQAKQQYDQAIRKIQQGQEREETVRQQQADRRETQGFFLTLGLAAAMASSTSANGTPTFTPSQLASMVYIPKYEKVDFKKQFPGLFETDGVRFLAFPDAGFLRSVGKLISPSGGFCSGFLWAPDVFVTNAHCVTDERGNLVQGDYTVAFQRILGSETAKIKRFRLSAIPWDLKRENDWAVIELDHPVALPYPFKGYAWDRDITRDSLGTAGYASDLNAGSWLGVHWGCNALNSSTTVFNHRCRTWGGASGSPIFIATGEYQGYLVGIHTAGTREPDFDRRVGEAVTFNAALRQAMTEMTEESQRRLGSTPNLQWFAY